MQPSWAANIAVLDCTLGTNNGDTALLAHAHVENWAEVQDRLDADGILNDDDIVSPSMQRHTRVRWRVYSDEGAVVEWPDTVVDWTSLTLFIPSDLLNTSLSSGVPLQLQVKFELTHFHTDTLRTHSHAMGTANKHVLINMAPHSGSCLFVPQMKAGVPISAFVNAVNVRCRDWKDPAAAPMLLASSSLRFVVELVDVQQPSPSNSETLTTLLELSETASLYLPPGLWQIRCLVYSIITGHQTSFILPELLNVVLHGGSEPESNAENNTIVLHHQTTVNDSFLLDVMERSAQSPNLSLHGKLSTIRHIMKASNSTEVAAIGIDMIESLETDRWRNSRGAFSNAVVFDIVRIATQRILYSNDMMSTTSESNIDEVDVLDKIDSLFQSALNERSHQHFPVDLTVQHQHQQLLSILETIDSLAASTVVLQSAKSADPCSVLGQSTRRIRQAVASHWPVAMYGSPQWTT